MERALWLEQMRYVQPKTAFSRFPRVHRQILKCTRSRFDPFATRPAMTAICAFRPKTPRRFGSDSGHLVADPIGHQVRFSPLERDLD
jgi:hypothetical protein